MEQRSYDARFVVVANRLPVQSRVAADGALLWERSPGGLVSALEPFLSRRHGAWVGWPGVAGVDVAPFTDGGTTLVPVRLSEQDVRDHYDGFANATLWPLYHDVVVRPTFDSRWWAGHVRVNERFARVAAETCAPGATVWVHDYQLQLVPEMLRRLRPDLRIGFFLHVPFPPVELFQQVPWRAEILRGMLAADLVGFQVPAAAVGFAEAAVRFAGARRAGPGSLFVEDRAVRVDAFPISVDAPAWDRVARRPEVRLRAAQIRAELGDPARVVLGVDRLDYTKGIDVRLRAIHEMLADGQIKAADTVVVQIANPARERVDQYRAVRDRVERLVSAVNGDHGRVGRPVVHYLHTMVDQAELAAFYLAADVLTVTPLRDGMNLVAKEYVASRHDGGGVLVLSEFAGAAAELPQALPVNPHHGDDVKAAFRRALELDPAEGVRRMRAMREHVFAHDLTDWAQAFLARLDDPAGEG
ncbi:trehalose-phosphate synthase [Actinoplanes sp. SE50]|uniref:alpha,alpha-trehalose-phosphate synthase (UDP-forming) n=1 Tax=unclassified Actinoplanes TaxID=2626549 RepID=UPI00023EC5B9|nr:MULTISPECIES: trehalose-6-phosphate synthase [unclassified Actinoplanes]AEV83074.1 alpha,alpha-trehalose-phosphate synthase (UDP-forming) [Actinoplanes sp. SE50/110]ATO81470.1 trehalose-phosphate synthase [Actinoplanes sp. SE50]SLL98877.1 trehalose-6-phosphate synthase [Actinoplanes sp. SE50/110]